MRPSTASSWTSSGTGSGDVCSRVLRVSAQDVSPPHRCCCRCTAARKDRTHALRGRRYLSTFRFSPSCRRVGENNGIRFPREFALLIKQMLYFDR